MGGISSHRAALRSGSSRLRPAETILFSDNSFIFNSRVYVTALAFLFGTFLVLLGAGVWVTLPLCDHCEYVAGARAQRPLAGGRPHRSPADDPQPSRPRGPSFEKNEIIN